MEQSTISPSPKANLRPRFTRPEDAASVCELIAAGDVDVEGAARMLGILSNGMRYWLHKLGYEASKPTGGINQKWTKVRDPMRRSPYGRKGESTAQAPAAVVSLPVPVIELTAALDGNDDPLALATQRLSHAAQLLQQADKQLSRLDAVEQELAALKEVHAGCEAIIERQRAEIVGLRTDADWGREERKRQARARLVETQRMFDEQVLRVSDHLHPPKQQRSS